MTLLVILMAFLWHSYVNSLIGMPFFAFLTEKF